jgi:hypothetical protein
MIKVLFFVLPLALFLVLLLTWRDAFSAESVKAVGTERCVRKKKRGPTIIEGFGLYVTASREIPTVVGGPWTKVRAATCGPTRRWTALRLNTKHSWRWSTVPSVEPAGSDVVVSIR